MEHEELRLGVGGPLYRVERAAHVSSLRRLIPLLLAITWAPLVVFALAHRATTGGAGSLIADLSVHARLLVAMPLFLVVERLLANAAHLVVARLFDEGFVPPGAQATLRPLFRSVARWRDAALPESLLLVCALAGGALALVGWIPPAGALHGLGESRYDGVRLWYGLLSLPVFQFVLWRALFRWLLWLRVLFGLARVPLRLLPAHADRRGGIGFVKLPNLAFCAPLLFGVSAILCAGWATQIAGDGKELAAFRLPLLLFAILGLLFAFAPLLVFTPQLLRARLVGERDYGALASDYVRRFQARWIDRADRSDLLGTQDIQSLSDVGNSYQSTVERMRPILFARADWILLLVALLLPTVPVLFTQGAAHDILLRLARMLVGTMP